MIYVADNPSSKLSRAHRERERKSKKEETHVLTETMSIKMAEMCRVECTWIY